jgi:uncharacterized protein (TIGR03067 family)
MRSHALLGVAIGLVTAAGLTPLRGSAGSGADAERVARLIKQLGDDQFRKREAASKELIAIGEPALGALRKAATSHDAPEVRSRAEQVIRAITGRAARADEERLEGAWVGVSHEENGTEVPVRNKVVPAQGRSVATNAAGAEVFRCTWRVIDATARPRQFDLVGPDGRVFQAIYQFDGTRLRYCGSYTQRPDGFSTKPGDGRYMATLTREAK